MVFFKNIYYVRKMLWLIHRSYSVYSRMAVH